MANAVELGKVVPEVYARGFLDTPPAATAPDHIGSAVEQVVGEITRRAEARKRPNPLWNRIVRSFEREWRTPWESMDGIQRGIVKVMYKHDKREATSPKPKRPPVPEPIRQGSWDPVPGFGGK